MEKEHQKLPYYAQDNEIRTILYSDMKMNDSNYSAADICFVCDTTGSMDRYIIPIRKLLIDFLNEITKLIYNYPRVAFIGYKDKDDENRIKSKGFTRKYEEIVDFIKGIKCEGGIDTCEDVIVPLKEALNLDWSSDLNYVYLITDAPTHGKSYHKDKYSDDYPDDDKDKPLEKLASHYRRSKINLSILRCNDSVDEMIEIIKEHYDSPASKLNVIEINDKDTFKEDFIKNFIISLINSFVKSYAITHNRNTNYSRYEVSSTRDRNYRIITSKAPQLEEMKAEYEMAFESSFKGKLNTGFIRGLDFGKKEYGYSIKLIPSTELECKISGTPIASGVFVECYPLNIDGNGNYVAKIPKRVAKKAEDLFSDIEGTLLTKVLADKFNFLLKQAEKKDKYYPVKVLSLPIIENLDFEKSKGQAKGRRFFLAQQLLDGEYVKFNNNYGWKGEDNDSCTLIAQAFSHFTYEYSIGIIMVTDIQGIKSNPGEIVITDPAIHSFLYKQRFGKTNHGKLGMIRFFMTHICNDYCKMLHLIHPNSINDATVQSMKEERKGEKALNHLYKKFEPDIKKWREKIRFFDQKLDPKFDSIEEESDEDYGGGVNSSLLDFSIKPKEG